MFFRVLSAMVVADAIDRRARKQARTWAGPSTSERHVAPVHAEPVATQPAARRREWDPRAPERPQ